MAVSYGSETNVTTTNWDTQADGDRDGSSSVDNGTNLYHAATLEITLDTGGTAPSSNDPFWEVWYESSTDGGTTYGGDAGVFLFAAPSPTTLNTATVFMFETEIAGIMPLGPDWRITVVNRLGNTSGADNDLNYVGKKAA